MQQILTMKKQKISTDAEDENPDRISMLPDHILLHIFEYIPMRDVLKTSLLSKRWKDLWKSAEYLSFSSADFFGFFDDEAARKKLTYFVDKTLVERDSFAPIRGFQIRFYDFLELFNPLIKTWLHIVMKQNMGRLILKFYSEKGYQFCQLPPFLFNCSTLEMLDLENCFVPYIPTVNWKCLRFLTMVCVQCDDGDIANILFGSPMLESFEYYDFCYFRRISLTSRKLRRFKLKDFNDEDKDGYFEIYAPYLEELEIAGCLHNLKFSLIDVYSLVDVKLKFENMPSGLDEMDETDYLKEYENMVMDLLKSVQHVKCLTLGSWFLQVISILDFEGLPVAALKGKHLALKASMTKYEFAGIARLLVQVSPQVETLSIYIANLQGELVDYFKKFVAHCRSYSFSLPSLKSVQIFVSGKHCMIEFPQRKLYDYDFIEFFLKTAPVLSKLGIQPRKKRCIWCHRIDCVSERLSLLVQKISASRHLFPQAEAVLKDLPSHF